jgi:transcriptional regulator with XRE-family HTH domain
MEVRCRRRALGLNQEELADVLGVKQTTVSRWESGGQVPPGVVDELDDLADDLERLEAAYVTWAEAAARQTGEPVVLLVAVSDEGFWAAHPDSDGLPVAVQQVAAGRAQRRLDEAGVEATIMAAPDSLTTP